MIRKRTIAIAASVIIALLAMIAVLTPTQTSAPSPSTAPTLTPSLPTPTPSPTPPVVRAGNVTVHFINGGQGDSIFIDTQGKDVLIDGGPKSAGSNVAQYLFRLNITRIDIIIATHPHEDHIGGLIVVMQEFELRRYHIQTVYDSGFKADTKTYQEYITLAQKRSIMTAERGERIELDSISWITILHPTQPPPFKEANDNSIVVRLQVSTISFLFTGDAEEAAERSMLAAQLDVKSTILKVGHHGSRTSTSLEFLRKVDPEVAIISVGKGNTYGHPHQETLGKLAAEGVKIYRTDLDGTIIISTDGTAYSRTIGK